MPQSPETGKRVDQVTAEAGPSLTALKPCERSEATAASLLAPADLLSLARPHQQ
jgi:hypothetical protein